MKYEFVDISEYCESGPLSYREPSFYHDIPNIVEISDREDDGTPYVCVISDEFGAGIRLTGLFDQPDIGDKVLVRIEDE